MIRETKYLYVRRNIYSLLCAVMPHLMTFKCFLCCNAVCMIYQMWWSISPDNVALIMNAEEHL